MVQGNFWQVIAMLRKAEELCEQARDEFQAKMYEMTRSSIHLATEALREAENLVTQATLREGARR